MRLKEFKYLVKFYTQDDQSKMPSNFEEWQLLIQRSLIKLANEITIDELIVKDNTKDKALRYLVFNKEEKIYIKVPDELYDENAEININEQLIMAVVFDVAEALSKDINIKQKLVLDRQEVINNYVWNKFIKKELSK